MSCPRIAVIGAGQIGRTHIALIQASTECRLSAIADPSEAGQQLAAECRVPWFPSLEALLAAKAADAVILATPNPLHVPEALLCIEAGIPALIEKPVAHSVAEGERLLARAKTASVALLVGHHRMHSPIMAQARAAIDAGWLGELVAVSGSALFYKPESYFSTAPWRARPGGGPVLINMIHEIGNLRYLCGEITAVQAMVSHARRGHGVEDTVTISLAFTSGALGSFLLSDTAASGRSWEQTARENPDYASYADEDCYHIAGTIGSLSVPTLRLKRYPNPEQRSWWLPMESSVLEPEHTDPLQAQLTHFCRVIRGEAEPLVSVHDGLQNLRVTEAIGEAARSGCRIIRANLSA
ncbi:MAG: Gfo/Idh/MocA family oxidoreductase [Thiothrix sp.]|nr:Gfo/Idh/MocA family oxidoreductase [Thiothrix sp.]HPE62351.1 Gfo/Idh/MocA family oxidoreductase [Thiolinea sp.]